MAPHTSFHVETWHVPGELMAGYYARRATAGLSVAVATMAL